MLRRTIPAIVLGLLVGSPATGQDWARKMFKESRHDFGIVARDAKAEFRFEVTNPYADDVHIAAVRTSCGCTTPRIEKSTLKSHETGAIVAHLNTDRYLGSRGATLTVTFDKPRYAEVQLQVSGNIRSDMVFDPGSVQLGSVEQGQGAAKKVTLTVYGRSNWKISEVRSANEHITAEAVESSRRGGTVAYKLNVKLDAEAEPGYIRDHLVLVTNDAQAKQIPLAVEGRVLAGVTVSPNSLFMGVVQPGERVTKQLVVKSSRPFRILSITCDDTNFEFDTSSSGEAKPVHLVPVTFLAGSDEGKVTKKIRIVTDLGNQQPELSAFAVIAAP
jgi:hypothetical protein